MRGKTLTRLDLSNALIRKIGVSRFEAPQLLESVLTHISDALVNGEDVKIPSFGAFRVRKKAARIGRNPLSGEEVTITPRRVLTFRPSRLVRDRVAEGNKAQ